VKFAFIAAERTLYPVKTLCRVLGLSTSGFYEYLKRLNMPPSDRDHAVRQELQVVHRSSRGTYGRPRLTHALRDRGHSINEKRVQRLMNEADIRGVTKSTFKPRTTDSDHRHPVAANLLERRFAVDSTEQAWVGDITYVPTKHGWLYLAVVIALRTRQVLGYCLSDTMREDLVLRAFRNAYATHPAGSGVIFHSDRGSQYAGAAFRNMLAAHGFQASMSRKGNCWDNAVAESFFATLKTEEVVRPYEDDIAAHLGIASYIHGFYNPNRLHSALGYRAPNDYAAQLKVAA